MAKCQFYIYVIPILGHLKPFPMLCNYCICHYWVPKGNIFGRFFKSVPHPCVCMQAHAMEHRQRWGSEDNLLGDRVSCLQRCYLDSPVSTSLLYRTAGIRDTHDCSQLYVGSRDLNSGSHACPASGLCTKPSPKPASQICN